MGLAELERFLAQRAPEQDPKKRAQAGEGRPPKAVPVEKTLLDELVEEFLPPAAARRR